MPDSRRLAEGGKLRIIAERYQLPGTVALLRNGKPVWVGDITAPWDDVECDTIIVAESDYDKISRAFGDTPG